MSVFGVVQSSAWVQCWLKRAEAGVVLQITDFAFIVAGIVVVLNLLSILIFKVSRRMCSIRRMCGLAADCSSIADLQRLFVAV